MHHLLSRRPAARPDRGGPGVRQVLGAIGAVAVLALSGCGGEEPPAAPSAAPSASGSAAGGGDPAFCAVAEDDALDTAQPGTQEYADGTAALAEAAPPELTEATQTLRTLGEVQLGLGTDGTAEELEAAMTARGIDAATLLGAFAAVGEYIETCNA